MTSVCGVLLPGMTLNATIFPDFPFPTRAVDFNTEPPPALHTNDPMANYVTALDERVESWEAWHHAKRRIVIAHSFGGMLALKWLLAGGHAASKVDRLLLLSTTAGPMYDVVRVRIATLGRREMRFGISGLIPFWNGKFVTRTVKRVMTGGSLAVREVDFRTLRNPTDLTIDFAGWKNTHWRAMRSYRTAMEGFDVRSQLSTLTMPTIVLHGSRDALFPLQVGEALAANIRNAQLRRIEGARHVVSLTHGHHVLEAAMDLLGTD